MRILHVVPSYFPAVRYGGPIVSVHGLCQALARLGHDVQVFTTNVDGPNDSEVPLGAPVTLDGVKVWYFPVPFARRLYWAPRMRAALRRQMDRFDVVHPHSVFLWPTWAAAGTARGSGVPYVVSPRGMLIRELIGRKSPWAKRAWITLVERRNLERAAAIHVTSNLEAAELRAFGFALPSVHVVPNGVDQLATGSQGTSCSAATSDLVAGSPYLLFLGRINWKKGLDRLIPALALLPDMRLIVAGNDEEAYLPALDALAEKHFVSSRIHFSGPAYGPDKQALLEHAAALVLPSYSENFGNVVLEAMAAACPVVVTPEVGAADIVRESGAGLVLDGHPDALAAGISGLLADPERLSTMGRRGREAIANRYTWDAVARTMEDLYRDVVAK